MTVGTLECPHCHKEIHVPDGMAGKTGKCPHCKGLVTVPQEKPKDREASQTGGQDSP